MVIYAKSHSFVLLLDENVRCPQGDTLGRIYFLSINSFNWDFNSLSSSIFIQYRAFELGTAPGTSSMVKSNSLFRGNLRISSGNTSTYYFKTSMSSTFNLSILIILSSSVIVTA